MLLEGDVGAVKTSSSHTPVITILKLKSLLRAENFVKV